MTTPDIIFEQPLTERMRLFLRAEHLAKQLEHFRYQENFWESNCAFMTLVELFSLFERSDIKTEVCKELDKHVQRLSRLHGVSNINAMQLNQIIRDLQNHMSLLQDQCGKIGLELRKDELLNNIRQRLAIPGSTCSFDTPAYHYWLNAPVKIRIAQFDQWLESFIPVSQALAFVLELTRGSADFQTELAHQGFYQKNLESHIICPLIQIKLNQQLEVFPEISGGKFRFSIRFWKFTPNPERAEACHSDIPFALRCCII